MSNKNDKPVFRNSILHASSGSSGTYLELSDNEDGDTRHLRNIGNKQFPLTGIP